MRNKAKGFPSRISLSGEPRAKEEFASQRADGTTKDRPRERMFHSGSRNNESVRQDDHEE